MSQSTVTGSDLTGKTHLGGEVSELTLHPLSNGSKQVITRMVPHDRVCIHHVGQGLGAQFQVGLVLGHPFSEAVNGLLCKGLQQAPDLDWIIADLG